MNALRGCASISRAYRACRAAPRVLPMVTRTLPSVYRGFHAGPSLWGVKSQVLQDVGEGKVVSFLKL